MRSRSLTTILLALIVALLAASSADARLTTKLMVGKDGGKGGLGLGLGQLLGPSDADVGPNGEIYVLVPTDCSVRVFDSAGVQLRQFGSCPSSNISATGGELLTSPIAISVDAKARVYVSTTYYLTITDKNGQVLQRFNSGSSPLATNGTSATVTDPAPNNPSGATSLYFSNSIGNRVEKYSVAYADNAVTFDWAAGKNVTAGNAETGYEVCTVFVDCTNGVADTVDGFNNPGDLDIASPAGPLMVANNYTSVVRLNPDTGAKIDSFPLPSVSALSLAARTDGGVWVAPAGQEYGELIALDSTGTEIDSIGTHGAPSAAQDGIGGAYGIGSTSDGKLVVADAAMHRAGLYAADGTTLRLIGKHDGIGWQRGSGSGEFSQASDVVPDGSGGFWALDYGNKRVVRYDVDGTQLDSIDLTTIGSQVGISQYGPSGMGISPAGTQLYVADSANQRIIRFDVDVAGHTHTFNRMVGKDVDTAAGTGTEVCTVAANCQRGLSGGNTPDNGSFNYPVDVAVSPNGLNVWVVEQNSQRLQRFDTLFNWGSTVGSYPADSVTNGKFANPQAIAFESDSSMWVSDYSGRVQNLDGTGAFIKKFRPGNGVFGVTSLVGLAVSGSDIYVVETDLARVAVYPTSTDQPTGPAAPASTFGAIGSNAGQFYQPRGISAYAGNVYVAELGNSRVQVIGEDTVGLGAGTITFNSPTSGDKIFNKDKVQLNYTAQDLDGEAMTCTPASGSFVPLASVGTNQIKVSCDDPLNVVDDGDAETPYDINNSVSVTRVDDLNAPTVVIDTPVDGSTQSTNSVVLDFGANDDQDPDPLDCDRTVGDTITLSPGANAITVNCTDWAGNVGSATATVTYTPPVVIPTEPTGPGGTPPAPAPNATIKIPKKIKFKGTVSATVTCDRACPLVFTVTAKVGKKKYSAKAKTSLSAAGSVVLKAKFKKSATKAILKASKSLKLNWTLSYGATTGKSGSVKKSK